MVVFVNEEECFEPCFTEVNEGKELINTNKLLSIPCLRSDCDELDFTIQAEFDPN